jgi:hypothetical protein
MGKQVHSVYVVGLASVYPGEARGCGRRCARLSRQALHPLLFIVRDVYDDECRDVALGGLDEVGDLLETSSPSAADVYYDRSIDVLDADAAQPTFSGDG